MRGRLAAGLLLLLAGCIPGGRASFTREQSPAQHRQCLADLARLGVRFEALPDRDFKNGCSATQAVKLVAIGTPVTNLGAMKCRLAERFTAWAGSAVQNAAAVWLETTVAKIESFGTYNCRPINNIPGGRLSEHGRANAVDISAFVLADGRRITVKEGWRGSDPAVRDFLRAVHKAACRRFDVVIGPDGDAHHYDHLHFDMGGNGPYCR